MKIDYGSNKLRKQMSDASERKRAFGHMATKVSLRIAQIIAADTLQVLIKVPGAACHQLSGNRSTDWAVSVSGNFRMIFSIDHQPIPINEEGSINLDAVTNIMITGVEDYH